MTPLWDVQRYIFAARSYASRLRSAGQWGIPPDALVLDVGSGQDPYPRANVLVDRFLMDPTERTCGGQAVVDRPTFVADATKLPFRSQTFDFVTCSHLLEHVSSPGALLDELQRVAPRGYIETPSPVYEKLLGWSFHRWTVSDENGRLLIRAKDRVIFDGDLHAWFSHNMTDRAFWAFFLARMRRYGLLTCVLWSGTITYEIQGETFADPGRLGATDDPVDNRGFIKPRDMTIPGSVKSFVSRAIRRRSDRRLPEVVSNLRCPDCMGVLRTESPGYRCSRCGRGYRIDGMVTYTLPSDAE